jgi:hypothetical protein
MEFHPNWPRGPNGGPLLFGEELCPICECCSMDRHECDNCGGEGVSGHECGEDTCCCLDPEDNVTCDWCMGKGGHLVCLGGCDFEKKQSHQKKQESE